MAVTKPESQNFRNFTIIGAHAFRVDRMRINSIQKVPAWMQAITQNKSLNPARPTLNIDHQRD
ncbi:MAG: hypothetical protein JMN25_14800 [gamma proteobacterium endosymbiont of Lamellibrachia anaximandri]|nr:hypothetical protein [gamma proteobacterium endosymbiont of Lamellibrachia anaximandri]